MRQDYYQKYIEREWHDDYRRQLICPFVSTPYTATFIEEYGDRVLLEVVYATGVVIFVAVLPKPANWMEMDKNDVADINVPRVGYAYDTNGPFGYERSSIAELKTLIDDLNAVEQPVVEQQIQIEVPSVAAPVIVDVPACPIVKKKRPMDMTYDERMEHNRRMRLARFAIKAAKVQSQ